MSLVTNVIVNVSVLEESAVRERLMMSGEYAGGSQTVRPLTTDEVPNDKVAIWGGRKYPECDLYGAAFNYLNLAVFLVHIERCGWKHPDHVQVFVLGQEDDRWSVWEFGVGGLVCRLNNGFYDGAAIG